MKCDPFWFFKWKIHSIKTSLGLTNNLLIWFPGVEKNLKNTWPYSMIRICLSFDNVIFSALNFIDNSFCSLNMNWLVTNCVSQNCKCSYKNLRNCQIGASDWPDWKFDQNGRFLIRSFIILPAFVFFWNWILSRHVILENTMDEYEKDTHGLETLKCEHFQFHAIFSQDISVKTLDHHLHENVPTQISIVLRIRFEDFWKFLFTSLAISSLVFTVNQTNFTI